MIRAKNSVDFQVSFKKLTKGVSVGGLRDPLNPPVGSLEYKRKKEGNVKGGKESNHN